jgi:hypothetical protein
MLKRVALLGAIAALTSGNPSNAVAQGWGGSGWGGGVTVTVSGFPGPYPYYRRPYYPRPCCYRPYIPRRVWCCHSPYYARPYYRPPYFYGDNFAPYGYNWEGGGYYNEASYGGYE